MTEPYEGPEAPTTSVQGARGSVRTGVTPPPAPAAP